MYDIDQWELFCAKHPGIFLAAIVDQTKIKEKCGGKEFWESIQNREFPWGNEGEIVPLTVSEYLDKVNRMTELRAHTRI